MHRLYFVLSLLVLGIAACMSGNQDFKETPPAASQPLNLLVTTSPHTPTPNLPDCTDSNNAPDAQLVHPVLQLVEPSSAAPGEVVRIIASGGYLTWEDAFDGVGKGVVHAFIEYTIQRAEVAGISRHVIPVHIGAPVVESSRSG